MNRGGRKRERFDNPRDRVVKLPATNFSRRKTLELRFKSQSGAAGGLRTRRAALVLLALFLHAALAGATHIHQTNRGLTPPAPDIAAGANEKGHAATDTAGHAQCILCRLQRDLSSGLRNAASAVTEPPPATPRFDAAPLGARHRILRGLSHGRAPPLA